MCTTGLFEHSLTRVWPSPGTAQASELTSDQLGTLCGTPVPWVRRQIPQGHSKEQVLEVAGRDTAHF